MSLVNENILDGFQSIRYSPQQGYREPVESNSSMNSMGATLCLPPLANGRHLCGIYATCLIRNRASS